MEALKEKNGNRLLDILVIGKITVKMGSVFSFIKMEISTKACGDRITDTAKVLTGEMRVESSEENIQEIGSRIRNMVEVHSSIKMEIDMTATGSMVNPRVRAE